LLKGFREAHPDNWSGRGEGGEGGGQVTLDRCFLHVNMHNIQQDHLIKNLRRRSTVCKAMTLFYYILLVSKIQFTGPSHQMRLLSEEIVQVWTIVKILDMQNYV
jgi:hypothetical protein